MAIVGSLGSLGSKAQITDVYQIEGYVDWELIDEATNKVVSHGRGYTNRWYDWILQRLPNWISRHWLLGDRNAIVDVGRNKLADAFIGTSITYPQFVGIGTGTNNVAAGDTALQTPVDYDGSNEAKQAATRNLRGDFTSRITTNFTTSEANQNIRELGLFDAANSGTMWARVRVTINKTSTQRLNVFWYITFSRRSGLAIKSGESITATGTTIADTASTLTFLNTVSIWTIHNNSGVRMYIKLNGALVGTPPTNYDFLLESGDSLNNSNEEVEVSTISVYLNSAITLPSNLLVVKGW